MSAGWLSLWFQRQLKSRVAWAPRKLPRFRDCGVTTQLATNRPTFREELSWEVLPTGQWLTRTCSTGRLRVFLFWAHRHSRRMLRRIPHLLSWLSPIALPTRLLIVI